MADYDQKYWIEKLELQAHPEGGFFRETYRSQEQIAQIALPARFEGARSFGTAIYFMLTGGNFSAFHRILADETWHFYDGHPVEVLELREDGKLERTVLGNNPAEGQHFQYTVSANRWFGSRLLSDNPEHYGLVGCTVAPGFDFADFEMAERENLLSTYPQHQQVIRELTRD